MCCAIIGSIHSSKNSFRNPIFFPANVPFSRAFFRHALSMSLSNVVASRSSFHAMISKRVAASSTVLVITPTWSNDDAIACTPYLLTLPYVGFKPTIPHINAGSLTDHPVSVQSAPMHVSSATLAADHPEDHPGIRLFPSGFMTGPNDDVSLLQPMANSSRFVFPIKHAPACSRRSKHVALYGATKSFPMSEPNVVFTHFVKIRSLSAIGAHARGFSLSVEKLFWIYSSAKEMYAFVFALFAFAFSR